MNWEKKDIAPELVRDLAAKYGCALLEASILARRGVTTGEEICFYLENDLRHLHNPFLFAGMEDAVERILSAKEEGEKVLVFGDRDVDGITSTTLLTENLVAMGIDTRWRLPVGDDPYGLTVAAVEEFAADYGSLIITVDCGISNLAEIDRAAELGVDVIVVDHHNPPATLPRATVIINPKMADSQYPFRDLAGCGVTYKLVSALRFAQSELFRQDICLLNVRPVTEAYVIEAVKIRNLVSIDKISETVVPGLVALEKTRLLPFLQGQQIFTWDAPLIKKTLAAIFGNGIEIHLLDIAPEIGKVIPSTAGKSLVRIKEMSRLAKYAGKTPDEIDVLVNLFVSFVHKKGGFTSSLDEDALQLVALGTLADLMPLKDENRILVRAGLEAMQNRPRQGIADLIYKLGLSGKKIGGSELSWQLCPAINATGRMGSPDTAVRLLLHNDKKERNNLADGVILMNENRKKLGNDVWTAIEPMAIASLPEYHNNMVFVFGQEIHRGITGVIASRLVSRFKVPALVVSFSESETVTGSMRSTRAYDVRGLLEQCGDLFDDWGGHDYAAGFSLPKSNWAAFLERLKIASATIELADTDQSETLFIDAELPPAYLTPAILETVDLFEPYGEQNPSLLFMSKGLKIVDLMFMGKPEQKHVKLTLDSGTCKWPALYWQAAGKVPGEFDLQDTVDVVFQVGRNYYNGTETPQLTISDLRRTTEKK